MPFWHSVAGTWLFSALLSMPPLIGWSEYGYLDTQSFCFCDWKTSISYTFFMVGMCFGGPCSTMTFCYVKILLKVRHSKRKLSMTARGSKHNAGYDSTDTDNPSEQDRINKTAETQLDILTPASAADSYRVSEPQNERRNSRSSRSSQKSRRKRSSGVEVHPWTTDDMIDGSYLSDCRVNSCPGRLHASGLNRVPLTDTYTTIHTIPVSPAPEDSRLPYSSSNNINHETVGGGTVVRSSSDISADGCTINCMPRSHAKSCNVRNSTTSQSADPSGRYSQEEGSAADPNNQSTASPEDLTLSQVTPAKRSGSLDISSHLRTLTKRLRSDSTNTERKSKSGIDEMKLIKMFLVVILVFVICWLPFCITMFYYVFHGSPAPRTIDMLTILLGCTNSACNPIIYGLMNKKYRQGYERIFCCLCNRVRARWGDPVSFSQTPSS